MIYDDPERACIDILVGSPFITVQVGNTLPENWKPEDGPFIRVTHSATPTVARPAAWATIAVTAWADSPTIAKGWAAKALAVLEAHDGSLVPSIRILTGAIPGRDPDSRAFIASGTVRVAMRGRALAP